MTEAAQLNPREAEVLAAVCREHAASGDPVASGRLVRAWGLPYSAATVRKVMAGLEERGLLARPHTSAGCVPTDAGLRRFVDAFRNGWSVSPSLQRRVRERLRLGGGRDAAGVLREASRALSELSQQCALALLPRLERATLDRIEFVPLGDGRLVAILVAGSGAVQHRIVEVDRDLGGEELERIHRYLNDLCAGHALAELRARVEAELRREEVLYDAVARRALGLGARVLSAAPADPMLVEGRAHLLEGRVAADAAATLGLLRALEDKRVLLRLLDETIRASGVRVFIGEETNQRALKGWALVAASYGAEEPLGTLGLIGPAAMDYPRLVPLVDFAATLIGEALARA